MTEEIQNLIEARGEAYGPSWSIHGEVTKPVRHLLTKFNADVSPFVWPWHAILNKLIRVLTSPMKRDHWIDIQGYAQLVIDMIDRLTESVEKEAKEENVE